MTRTIMGLVFVFAGIGIVILHLIKQQGDPSISVIVFGMVLTTIGGVAIIPEVVAEWAKDARKFLPEKWRGSDA